MQELELMVTLWPSFPHFEYFANDPRISGIRLNSAMMENPELEKELELIERLKPAVPLYFDIKGRQLRIKEVNINPDYLDIRLNHPISVETPTPVLFKAGADGALLDHLEEDGQRLIFEGGPRYMVKKGESLHIRDNSLQVRGSQFTAEEVMKIGLVKSAGFSRYFLSYVQNQEDVDEFMGMVGRDREVFLKIEDQKGLEYVRNQFIKKPNLLLVAARGDLYVEVDKPHQILSAMRLIVEKDPQALAGSRFLLTVVDTPIKELEAVLQQISEHQLTQTQAAQILFSRIYPTVPACVDFSELAWFYDIGYRKMMLCDELCLKGELLTSAINAFESFRKDYPNSLNNISSSEVKSSKPWSVNYFRGRLPFC